MTVFTPEQEVTLMKTFKDFEYLFYGLSEKECRMLAYQMVISEDMKIPIGWKHGMASIGWLTSFQLRHSSFMNNLEKPVRMCSRVKLQRSRLSDRNTNWENKTVNIFYDDLEEIIHKNPNFKENRKIYSLDEAYTSIYTGKRIVDRENRSDLLTTCCIICADGTSFPPVIIRPNHSLNDCSDTELSAVFLTGSLGRLTPNLFTEVMTHFIKHSQSSLSNPSILIMDTDLSHLSYTALTMAKESGVHILSMHPHVSCLLQPLQGEIFDLFDKTYNAAMEESRIQDEDGHVIVRTSHIDNFIRKAYSTAMTPENILKGFKKCGISPFDRDLFSEIDYQSCLDRLEHACIECKVRDNRYKGSLSKKNPKVKDEDQRGSLDESQVEKTTNPASDGGDSSQSEEIKNGDQEARSDW